VPVVFSDTWCGIDLNFENPSTIKKLSLPSLTRTQFLFIGTNSQFKSLILLLNADILIWKPGSRYSQSQSNYFIPLKSLILTIVLGFTRRAPRFLLLGIVSSLLSDYVSVNLRTYRG